MTKKSLALCGLLVGLLGLNFAAGADPARPIPVAFLGAFTGPDLNTSKELYRGVEVFLALEPAAQARLRFETFDNQGEIDMTVRRMQEIRQKGYRLVLGLANSNEAIAAAKLAQSEKMLFITPFATSRLVTENNPYAFRACYSDDFQGDTLATFAKQVLKPKKAVILRNIDSQYSIGLAARFALGVSGSISTQTVDYERDSMNLEKLFASVKSFNPGIVFIPDHITKASLIAKRINKELPQIKFLGADGFGGEKMFMSVMAGAPTINLYFSTHWSKEIAEKTNTKFLKQYISMFPGEEPTSGAALGFDTAALLWKTLEKNQFHADPESLSAKIEDLSFDSTVGSIKFPEGSHHSPQKPVVIMKYENGKFQLDRVYHP